MCSSSAKRMVGKQPRDSQRGKHCTEAVMSLYNRYGYLRKNKNRQGPAYRKNTQEFQHDVDQVFNIQAGGSGTQAHAPDRATKRAAATTAPNLLGQKRRRKKCTSTALVAARSAFPLLSASVLFLTLKCANSAQQYFASRTCAYECLRRPRRRARSVGVGRRRGDCSSAIRCLKIVCSPCHLLPQSLFT